MYKDKKEQQKSRKISPSVDLLAGLASCNSNGQSGGHSLDLLGMWKSLENTEFNGLIYI